MLARGLAVVAAVFMCATASFAQKVEPAHASIINAEGKTIGDAKILPWHHGVKIELKVSGLPPGAHAIHIHTVGKCDTPDFKTAGGHFNPDSKQHGKENPQGPHAGDLQNISADANGSAKVTLYDAHATLGGGANSLFHEGGTSLVIHEKADDYKTDPAGNSGNRIACGVIQK